MTKASSISPVLFKFLSFFFISCIWMKFCHEDSVILHSRAAVMQYSLPPLMAIVVSLWLTVTIILLLLLTLTPSVWNLKMLFKDWQRPQWQGTETLYWLRMRKAWDCCSRDHARLRIFPRTHKAWQRQVHSHRLGKHWKGWEHNLASFRSFDLGR